MANLYNKAGLINIPVGYSDGFLYNIKPTDNTLAFRFDRASSATRVNEKGLIEQVGYFGPELVTNGNFATDSDWSKGTGWSIANGNASYDGSGTGYQYILQSITTTSGSIYKINFDVLSSTGTNLNIVDFGAVRLNQTHLNQGNYTFYAEADSTSENVIIYANGTDTFSIDNVSVTEVLGDKPRIDYTDSLTSPSFLLEPQSTNLITYSEDFSGWTKQGNISISSNNNTSPSGSLDATLLSITDTSTTTKIQQTITVTSGNTYTFSVYLKSDSNLTLEIGGISGSHIVVNTTNEWQRFSVTQVASSNNRYPQVKSNGTQGNFYMWGAQLEEKSYATSYIPTAGSTATRVAETCNGAGNASTFNDSEGVLYAEISALADDGTNRVISLSDGTANERVLLSYINQTNTIRCFIKSSGSFYATLDKVVSDITDFHKIAYKYKSGETKLFVDGSLINSSSNTFSITGLNVLQFANGTPYSNPFYGKVKGIYVFNEALTDDELQQLTGPEYNSFAALAAAYNYTVI